MDYEIRWSAESVRNLDEILVYLRDKWTDREINAFKKRLTEITNLIKVNPFQFQESVNRRGYRIAVLSKQISIIYYVEGEVIFLVYLIANKSNHAF